MIALPQVILRSLDDMAAASLCSTACTVSVRLSVIFVNRDECSVLWRGAITKKEALAKLRSASATYTLREAM
jgi:hypothetical protein